MEELLKYGFGDNDIKQMLELCPNILNLEASDILLKINMLEAIGCTSNQVINIISSNSMYLDKTRYDIISLMDYLLKNNFRTLDILFDSNPFVLNLEPFEIENYINNRVTTGESREEIIDDLDSNPALFLEI